MRQNKSLIIGIAGFFQVDVFDIDKRTWQKVETRNYLDPSTGQSGNNVLQITCKLQRSCCAFHVIVQTNFRQYYFYFLPDQAQILLDHFNVLDKF